MSKTESSGASSDNSQELTPSEGGDLSSFPTPPPLPRERAARVKPRPEPPPPLPPRTPVAKTPTPKDELKSLITESRVHIPADDAASTSFPAPPPLPPKLTPRPQTPTPALAPSVAEAPAPPRTRKAPPPPVAPTPASSQRGAAESPPPLTPKGPLQRPWTAKKLWPIYGLVALIVLGVGFYFSTNRPEDSLAEVEAEPQQATAYPTTSLVGGGRLLVDARPWGEVTSLLNSDGEEIQLPLDRQTPLVLDPSVPM